MKKIILSLLIIIIIIGCKKETEKSISLTNTTERKALKIYQSCGKLSIGDKTKEIEVRTMLPILVNGGTYKYLKYFNISNGKEYGILGVLTIDGEPNIDLRKYTPKDSALTQVDLKAIDLTKFSSYNGGLDFSGVTSSSKINFICFHDNEFLNGTTNIDSILKFYQKNLPNILAYKDTLSSLIPEPKVGDGGILTVDGCK